MSRLRWAEERCNPLPSAGSGLSTGVHTGESTAHPFPMQPGGRMAPMRRFMESVIDSEASTDEEAAREYARELFEQFLLVPAVLLILILVIILPCYICRCCAHRGPCKPRASGYGRRDKLGVGGCCSLFYVLTTSFSLLAAAQMLDLTPGMQHTLCGAHNLFGNVTGTLTQVHAKLSSVNTALGEVNASLTILLTNTNCL
ncbi:MAG: hypothetical protein SGPRY_013201, partial [Prymnesium sp.]